MPLEATVQWRVSETGRVAHLVDESEARTGAARCGETGLGWRLVPGMPVCPECLQLADAD